MNLSASTKRQKFYSATRTEPYSVHSNYRGLDLGLPFYYTNGTMMKGRELRAIRTKLRWTQMEMAKALKVAGNTVARWERNERPISRPMAKLVEIIFATERKTK